MSPELGEALRGLCRRHGWSYAVLWRADPNDPRLQMVMEGYYAEEQTGNVIDEMREQVHKVGQGTIGVAAASGKHHWVYSDANSANSVEVNPKSPIEKPEILQGPSEWENLFSSGIKTIVIISLPLVGVLQCGSTEKISENLEFIDEVELLFRQLESMKGPLPADSVQAIDIDEKCSTLGAATSSDVSHSNYSNIKFVHDASSKKMTAAMLPANVYLHPSSFLPSRFHHDVESQSIISSMSSWVSDKPVISHSTHTCKGVNNPVQETIPIVKSLSKHTTNHCQGAGAEAQPLFSPNFFSKSTPCLSGNSEPIQSSMKMWHNNFLLDQRYLSGTENQGFPSMSPSNSSTFVPQPQTLNDGRSSSSYTPQCTFSGIVHDSRPSDHSKYCLYDEGKFLEASHSSASFVPVIRTGKTSDQSSVIPSLVSELPRSFVSQESMADHTSLVESKVNPFIDAISLANQPSEGTMTSMPILVNEIHLPQTCASSGLVGNNSPPCGVVENSATSSLNSLEAGYDGKRGSSNASPQLLHENELFDVMDLDLSPTTLDLEPWDAVLPSSYTNLSTSVSECVSALEIGPTVGIEKGMFPESLQGQFLDVEAGNANITPGHFSASNNVYAAPSPYSMYQSYRKQVPLVGLSCADFSAPEYNLEKIMHGAPKESSSMSHGSLWIDDSCSINAESAVTNQPKKSEEPAKVAKRRAKPGESSRPRPKDRQLIQDRVKELREIVPNGAKCSIDALLDRTIKYMLFMQSLMKYAGKLRQVDEPKMIGDGSGVILKDNSNGDGGATWAYEVAGQTMVCPIIVEDLNPPGQMIIEMLCEERGFFLEVADTIHGFGLTILKGVMEAHNCRIWARFLVEANKDLTRMDIFLSLVQLLQQTSAMRPIDQISKVIDKGVPEFNPSQQTSTPIPVSLAERLQ